MRKEIGSAEEQPISAIFDAGHASVAPVIGVFYVVTLYLAWWQRKLRKPLLDRAIWIEKRKQN